MEILLPRMNDAHEIVGTQGGALLPERAPGEKPRRKPPRVYRPTDPYCARKFTRHVMHRARAK